MKKKTIAFTLCLLAVALFDCVAGSLSYAPVLASVIPGEGAPLPTCYPGKNCGDIDNSGAAAKQTLIAGEGAPLPTCYPGKNCGDGDQSR